MASQDVQNRFMHVLYKCVACVTKLLIYKLRYLLPKDMDRDLSSMKIYCRHQLLKIRLITLIFFFMNCTICRNFENTWCGRVKIRINKYRITLNELYLLYLSNNISLSRRPPQRFSPYPVTRAATVPISEVVVVSLVTRATTVPNPKIHWRRQSEFLYPESTKFVDRVGLSWTELGPSQTELAELRLRWGSTGSEEALCLIGSNWSI